MKIYLAGPIFTERDRMYLDYIYDNIKTIFPTIEKFAVVAIAIPTVPTADTIS